MTATPALRAGIEATLRSAGVPGASIAVVDPSQVLWADGFGIADVVRATPARADTVYHLFSGTKLFTAVAILQLVERGRLSLDDEIGAHVPTASHLAGVRLRHLLSHVSGLDDTLKGFLTVRFPGEPAPTTARALAGYRLRSAEAPGRRVRYRNVNYALLGDVISRVSGAEYTEHVTREILRPLGMDAVFSVDDADASRFATGTMSRWDPMRLVLRVVVPDVARRVVAARAGRLVSLAPYDLVTAAAGGLIGTVEDFARFVSMHLSRRASVLSAASIDAMQTMVAKGATGIASRVGVGIGWKIGRDGDRTFLNHEGGGAGFTSELRLYPASRLGIAIAMNAMSQPRTMRVAHRLSQAIVAAHDPR